MNPAQDYRQEHIDLAFTVVAALSKPMTAKVGVKIYIREID